MGRTLVLQVPDGLYETLKKAAGEAGRSAEEVAMEWLEVGEPALDSDPWEKLIGVVGGQGLDWADGHDYYLGESSARGMKVLREGGDPDHHFEQAGFVPLLRG